MAALGPLALPVARFEPFRALRYAVDDLAAVLAPPYDVVDQAERARLQDRHPHNAMWIEAGVHPDGADPYGAARDRLAAWVEEGVVVADAEPTFTLYRMGYRGRRGEPRQVTGVLGALGLDPGGRHVLPHERTLRAPAADRLALLRACQANLSPIWGLSPTPGLADVLEPSGSPLARATDEHGVHHRVWRVDAPATVAAISEVVGRGPVVLADGHHRYQTALAYRAEVRAANGDAPGPHDLVLAFLVELDPDQLDVRPIHRVVSGLDPATPLPEALEASLELELFTGDDAALVAAMEAGGALGVARADRRYLARSRLGPASAAPPGTDGLDTDTVEPGLDTDTVEPGLDTDTVARVLEDLGPHTVCFEPDLGRVRAALDGDPGAVAFLVRPVTVDTLRAVASAGLRLPQKTTYFTPKPATGIAFRSLDGPARASP